LLEESDEEGVSGRKVRLQNGQVAWLGLHARWEDYGYLGAKVELERPKLEEATLAAVVALQGKHVEPTRVRYLFRLDSIIQEWISSDSRSPERLRQALKNDARLRKVGAADWSNVGWLRRLRTLVRHHRPDFDGLDEREQVAMLERAQKHVDEYLRALKSLTDFLEHGDPYRGRPRKLVTKQDRDVRAVELREIAGLTQQKIGEVLGVKPPSSAHGTDNPNVRWMINGGMRFLKEALGEDGYEKYIEDKRAEKARWPTLSEDEQRAIRLAEALGITVEDARHTIAGDEELREFLNDLDEG